MYKSSLALKEYDFLTSSRVEISAIAMSERFGARSDFYLNAKQRFLNFYKKIQSDPSVKLYYESWTDIFEKIYGYHPDVSLFIDHIYLIALAKILVYVKLGYDKTSKIEFEKIFNGEYFQTKGITNFDEDFSGWLFHPEINNGFYDLIGEFLEEFYDFDFSKIDEDVFSAMYQEIVERKERHKAGEYYTPGWLVELILSEALSYWEQQNSRKVPKIMDPACGSGTFIFRTIKKFRDKQFSLEDIVKNIQGFDLNPIAAFITKANYLLAINDLIDETKEIKLPIYIKDSIKHPDLFDGFVNYDKTDVLIGNPPWIVLRSLRSKEYQEFLKREILNYGLLQQRDVHLFTQLELATLFFCKSADLYLNKGGIIAFVMPRSVLAGTKNHINFRKFIKPPIRLLKIIDLEEVAPLFNMPSCVLFGLRGENNHYPVPLEKYKGKLNGQINRLLNIKSILSLEVSEYTPPNFSIKPSDYYDRFKVGASIFPRSLYFVDLNSDIPNSEKFKVKTSKEIHQIVKDPWKVVMQGVIDQNFLYATLLAWEVVPFGYIRLRPVVLPIKQNSTGYEIVDNDELQGIDRQTADWFHNTQFIWHERRTKNSEQRFPKLSDRLNYNGLLTIQNKDKRYVVVYNATGTNLVSCVVDKFILTSFDVNGIKIFPRGFILDVKTWFFETQKEQEAHYLSAILNSVMISKLIKPLQPKGLFGARAIHRRPLLLNIPEFDGNDNSHIKLAKISMKCEEKIKYNIPISHSNRIRAEIRRFLKDEISEIDSIVSVILNNKLTE